MMVYFYLTNNNAEAPKCDEPDAVKAASYIHVKGKSDGSATVIISEEVITDPNVVEYSQEDLQTILNGWTDAENAATPMTPEGVPIVQSYINLGIYLE